MREYRSNLLFRNIVGVFSDLPEDERAILVDTRHGVLLVAGDRLPLHVHDRARMLLSDAGLGTTVRLVQVQVHHVALSGADGNELRVGRDAKLGLLRALHPVVLIGLHHGLLADIPDLDQRVGRGRNNVVLVGCELDAGHAC